MDKRIFTQQSEWLGFALLLFVIVDTWVLGRFYLALQGLEIRLENLEWFALIFAVHMAGISLPALGKEEESRAFAWIIGIVNLAAICYFFEWAPSFELRPDGTKRFLLPSEKWSDWLPKGLASVVWATFVGYGYLQLPTAFTKSLQAITPKPNRGTVQRVITHSVKREKTTRLRQAWTKGLDQSLIEKLQSYSEQQARDRRKYLRRKSKQGSLNGERSELEALDKMVSG